MADPMRHLPASFVQGREKVLVVTKWRPEERPITSRSTYPPLGKLTGPAAVALAAIVAMAGTALAAGPVKGAKYSGPVDVTVTLTVSFKVSGSGKKVSSLRVSPSLPNKCGYGGPLPTDTSKPAKIKHRKFTAKITEKASSGTVIATATVTGKFFGKGKEKGTVKTNLPKAKSCNGSFRYSTKAQTSG
jgi:hypothetical protein